MLGNYIYYVQISDQVLICVVVDLFWVMVVDFNIFLCKVVMVKVFMFNFDNFNDIYGVSNFFVFIDFIFLEIFDCWGGVVFQVSDFFDKWDGIFKGEFVNFGVFLW